MDSNTAVIILGAVVLIVIISLLSKSSNKKDDLPYHMTYLLTKNEYAFYKRLTEVTEPLGLQILTKIRFADLVEVDSGIPHNEWNRYFSKIRSKHIDFAIADDMKVIILIELDDSSHQKQDSIERDQFKNDVLEKTGYTLVRTYGDTNIVREALKNKGYSIKKRR
ncbi:MAG: DUF2726 domain-containing protein [Ruminococcus sp.]|nr:DUF2726 domain-containing protein [Ruminococcus sp.]